MEGEGLHVKKTIKWKEVLNEGVSGAIKLLAELDWESTFNDIRVMRWAIIARLIGGVFIYYLFSQMILSCIISLPFVLSGLVVIYYDLYYLIMYILPIPIAMFISKSDFKKYYQKLGYADYLLWNLRWFYNEFKGAEFKA